MTADVITVAHAPNPEGVRYNGDWEIWIQELDLGTMKLKGRSMAIWKGAVKGCIWPEGPHIYKINGYYYLMHAEGGTGPEHSITIARSKERFLNGLKDVREIRYLHTEIWEWIIRSSMQDMVIWWMI